MVESIFDMNPPGADNAPAQAQTKSIFDMPPPDAQAQEPNSAWDKYISPYLPEGTGDAIKQGGLGFLEQAQRTAGDVGSALVGLPKDIASLASGNLHRERPELQYGDELVNATGVRADPQTPGQNIAANIGRMGANPLSLLGGGTGAVANVGRAANVVGSAVGQEAGHELDDELFKDTPFEGWGEFGGSLVGGTLAGMTTNPLANMARKKITTANLQDSANGKYAAARSINVPYDRSKISQLSDDIDQTLRGPPRGYREDLSGGTFRRVGELEDVAQQTTQPTFSDLEAKRQSLSTLRDDMWSQTGKPTAEASAADLAIKQIDKFLADPTNAMPGFQSQAAQTADLANSARGDWAAMKRAQQVEWAARKGGLNAATSGTGANFENTFRQQMKGILVNPKRLASFTPDQQSMIYDMAAGNVPRNTMRFLSRLATTGVVSTGAVLYIAQHLGLGHLGEAGLAAVGAANLMGAKAAMQGRINGLLDSIRADSPLGQATLTQQPVGALGTAFGKPSPGVLGKSTLKGTVGTAALRASENLGQNQPQSPPQQTSGMPGTGTKATPFQATSQAHIDWFKNSAPPGSMIMVNGKLYRK